MECFRVFAPNRTTHVSKDPGDVCDRCDCEPSATTTRTLEQLLILFLMMRIRSWFGLGVVFLVTFLPL